MLSQTSNLAREGPASLLNACAVSRNLSKRYSVPMKDTTPKEDNFPTKDNLKVPI